MTHILNFLQYRFQAIPFTPFKYQYLMLAIAIIGIIASIALKIYIKKNKEDKILKKLLKSAPKKFITISVLLILYVLARYEYMAYLSMRFVNFIIIGFGIYYLITYFNLYYKVYPIEKKKHDELVQNNKYLPRKKHK